MGEQDGNLARLAVVLSRLPITTGGMTINRFCSSGLQSIAIAANQIASGQSQVAIAGGVDSISMRTRQEDGKSEQNQRLLEEKPDIFMAMGNTAEVVARRYQVTREAAGRVFALQSQQRYAAAVEPAALAKKLCPCRPPCSRSTKKPARKAASTSWSTKTSATAPAPPSTGSLDLPPAFEEDGSVTAGNASQLSDGASMTLLMSAERAAQLGIRAHRHLSAASPSPVVSPTKWESDRSLRFPGCCRTPGCRQDDVDLWELNEAFASQALYCRDALDIDNESLQRNGGSIAIGHPFGMTGSRMTGAVLRELQRRNKKYGVVTMCIGGGQGAAGLFEAA